MINKKVQLFCYRADEKQLQVLKNLANFAFPDLETVVIDLCYTPVVYGLPEDIKLVFGAKAIKELHATNPDIKQFLELPDPKDLILSAKNKQTRLDTIEKIKEYTNSHNKVNVVTEDKLTDQDLATFNTKQLLSLYKLLDKQKVPMWSGTTDTNKSIAIVKDYKEELQAFDIVITFEELYAASTLVEIFNLKEIRLHE